jgi:hypothetical protein
MGIRGLQSVVSAAAAAAGHAREPLPAGAELIVDGDGWIFHILNRLDSECAPIFGGNYSAIDEAIRKEVRLLTESYGLRVHFYFGGKLDAFKERTMQKRMEQREMKWFNLYASCRDRKPSSIQDLPIPPLSIDQMRQTLADCGSVMMVSCDGESDQIIARAVRDGNQNRQGSFFCYALDSDFLVMKDCPYIEFGQISRKNESSPPSALVYRRAQTSSWLNLAESQLVELAISTGNDYTELFPRSDYREGLGTMKLDGEGSHTVIERISVVLRDLSGNYRVSSSNRELDMAIRYSRLFYNLFDVSSLVNELDEYRKSTGYVAPSVSLSVNLAEEEHNSIATWMSTKLKSEQYSFDVGVSAGRNALRFLLQKSSKRSPSIAVQLNNGECQLLSLHCAALTDMLNDIESRSSLRGSSLEGSVSAAASETRPSKRKVSFPIWKNVIIGHAFQSIASSIIKKSQKKSLEDGKPMNSSVSC